MKSQLVSSALLLSLLAATLDAASVTIDDSAIGVNIGSPTSAGNRGDIPLAPSGVLGWANYRNSLTPASGESGGTVAITATQVGVFTLGTATDNRFSQSWPGGSDTAGIRGQSTTGLAAGEGLRFSFVPGAIGNFRFTVHIGDFNSDVDYAVAQGGNPVASGGIAALNGNGATYDEGAVHFDLTVADASEAAATWDIDILRAATGGGNAILVGGVSLVATTPPEPPAPVTGLGRLLCIGDSITEGRATRPDGEGNWSWRYWCWENFIDFGIAHEFVGTRTANKDGSSVYPAYSGETFTNHHEAIWGTTFLERSASTPTFLGSLKSSGKTPDTTVIFGGGNDIPLNLSVDASVVRDRTKTIIDHLQGDLGTAANPNIRILLVSILPRFAAPPSTTPDVRNARYAEINTLLATLAVAETTGTSSVEFLDVSPLFSQPADGHLYDGIHPDGSGEQLLGNAIFAALVPDIEPVSLKILSIDAATRTIEFLARTHGPRQMGIEVSTDLSPSSWTLLIPPSLNPGEWTPVSYTHSASLPPRWFFCGVAP